MSEDNANHGTITVYFKDGRPPASFPDQLRFVYNQACKAWNDGKLVELDKGTVSSCFKARDIQKIEFDCG